MCKRSMVAILSLLLLPLFAGCATQQGGQLLVDRKEVAPIGHVAVVLVLPRPHSPGLDKALKDHGYSDGRFAPAFQARMQADLRANGVKADVYTTETDKAGNARISLVGAPYSHQLMLFPQTFNAARGQLWLEAVNTTLFDLKAQEIVWRSTEAIRVDPQGKGADRLARHILGSWVEVGLISKRFIRFPKGRSAEDVPAVVGGK